ncbi:MAG: hypothetical protein COA90_09105 [Gammaproteobacteria bacterium]|nr:MAG: hypothetical protein COA90_09105 [Gammaproteobacteria bacterium]
MKYITLLLFLFTFYSFAGDRDMNKPFVKEVFLAGQTDIKITFNERMSEVGLLNIENYTLVASQQTGYRSSRD